MKLEKIISISGKPSLFKLVSQSKNGFIVEDVTTKKKISINNSSQVSLLDDIAMFATDKEVPLYEVFKNVAEIESYKQTIPHKSPDSELKIFMEKALPNYDDTRVYPSDIKKLAQWYNILQSAGYITAESFVVGDPEAKEEPSINTDKAATKNITVKNAGTQNKVKASSSAKSLPKNTQRKQG